VGVLDHAPRLESLQVSDVSWLPAEVSLGVLSWAAQWPSLRALRYIQRDDEDEDLAPAVRAAAEAAQRANPALRVTFSPEV